jgi:hypothetical protein
MLPTNGGEAGILLIAAVLLGLTLPITPVQILWVNMVTRRSPWPWPWPSSRPSRTSCAARRAIPIGLATFLLIEAEKAVIRRFEGDRAAPRPVTGHAT